MWVSISAIVAGGYGSTLAVKLCHIRSVCRFVLKRKAVSRVDFDEATLRVSAAFVLLGLWAGVCYGGWDARTAIGIGDGTILGNLLPWVYCGTMALLTAIIFALAGWIKD